MRAIVSGSSGSTPRNGPAPIVRLGRRAPARSRGERYPHRTPWGGARSAEERAATAPRAAGEHNDEYGGDETEYDHDLEAGRE